MFYTLVLPTLRLKELCRIASIPVDPKQVKLEAWFVKGCCVLLKKKVSRAQWPRNRQFRLLMAALVGRQLDDGSDGGDGGAEMSVGDGGEGDGGLDGGHDSRDGGDGEDN